jgi:hypothetical protein
LVTLNGDRASARTSRVADLPPHPALSATNYKPLKSIQSTPRPASGGRMASSAFIHFHFRFHAKAEVSSWSDERACPVA